MLISDTNKSSYLLNVMSKLCVKLHILCAAGDRNEGGQLWNLRVYEINRAARTERIFEREQPLADRWNSD